jgi:hypothetical protein
VDEAGARTRRANGRETAVQQVGEDTQKEEGKRDEAAEIPVLSRGYM